MAPIDPASLARDTLEEFDADAEIFERLAGAHTEAAFHRQPTPGKWTAREHLLHLARHASLALARLERIRAESNPGIGRYLAEEDSGWAAFLEARPSAEQALDAWRSARVDLRAWAEAVWPEEWARTGQHPVMGEIALARLLAFWRLHEGHHLYQAVIALGAL